MMGEKGCPKHVESLIPIKLEFSASVGFIHKESVTMHGRTIVKFSVGLLLYERHVVGMFTS
jgi:hypothetical protein